MDGSLDHHWYGGLYGGEDYDWYGGWDHNWYGGLYGCWCGGLGGGLG